MLEMGIKPNPNRTNRTRTRILDRTQQNPVAWVLKSSYKFNHFCSIASVLSVGIKSHHNYHSHISDRNWLDFSQNLNLTVT